MKRSKIISMLFGLLFLAACAPASPGAVVVTSTPPSPTATPLPAIIATNTAAAPAPTNLPGELTPAQRASIRELSKKYNLPVGQIQILKTEAVTWPNGCLGVVLPGVMCTQIVTEGFRVVMAVNGKQYEFHTNQDGSVVIDAAQQLASIRLAVYTAQKTVELVDPHIPLGPTYNPAFHGFLPSGDSVAGVAYVLDFTGPARALSVDQNGTHELKFIQNPNYGLAVWRGGLGTQPRLAWGTQPGAADQPSKLQASNIDGSGLVTLVTQEADTNPPVQLVAELWSADGSSLYFSKEPSGIGGYILFAGASNLYQVDIATKKVTELIPMVSSKGLGTCLDAISGDYGFVADHCNLTELTILNLATGGTSTIQPPEGLSGFRLLGSARFSPDGSRVAFALAKGNPDDEQGWVAVSEGRLGGSKLILTGSVGAYYTVIGWLDDQTLLVQLNTLKCSPACANELWTVKTDGSSPTKVADGSFLAIIDNR